MIERIRSLLFSLYGEATGEKTFRQVLDLIERSRLRLCAPRAAGLTQADALLITYPDQVQSPGISALKVLKTFCDRHLRGVITAIHILPFYPWSSDDGFAVMDYRAVHPNYGSWEDVRALGEHFRLMFDAVVNHVSVQSSWFQGMLKGDPYYQDFFITPPPNADLSAVVRPRTLPLLTTFQTSQGPRAIWTTFSPDQADLNYHNPAVLLEMLDILLFYVSQGAQFLRLDAIAYLWKEPGTSCIHLSQTHWIVQFFRAVLDVVAPQVMLITETNVPHQENLTYFGDGRNEAQLVYNFALPPLVLHTFHTGSAEALSRWAEGLLLPSGGVTFLNFLASHDGIGVTPLRGILPEVEIERLVERTRAHGGLVSYKTESGRETPYELNINYYDALNPSDSGEPVSLQIERFLAAHAILLSLQGLPALYFHSLFGLRGWSEGVRQTGYNRSINRQKFLRSEIEDAIADARRREAQVFAGLKRLLNIRAAHPAFHPFNRQKVLRVSPTIFGLLRSLADEGEQVLCLHNVSHQPQEIAPEFFKRNGQDGRYRDLLTDQVFSSREALFLAPYQFLWLSRL